MMMQAGGTSALRGADEFMWRSVVVVGLTCGAIGWALPFGWPAMLMCAACGAALQYLYAMSKPDGG